MTDRALLRGSIALAAVAALLVLSALALSPSPSATHDGPNGTAVLKQMLTELGVRVSEADLPPEPPGAFVLLEDLRTARQDAELLAWAGRGGRLIVVDPASEVLPLLGVRAVNRSALRGTGSLQPGCAGPEVLGVRALTTDVSEPALEPVAGASVSCFHRATGSFAILVERGRGRAILLAGPSPLVNASLGQADNARFAAQLMGTAGSVVFGSAGASEAQPAGPASIWDLLPERARAALVGLALAAVAFALVRGRRLGRAPSEEPISPIPGSELVRASAGLYRKARAVGFSGRLLREGVLTRLGRRLGLPERSSPETVASLVAASAGVPEAGVRAALAGPEPRTDEELIGLARTLEEIERRMEPVRR